MKMIVRRTVLAVCTLVLALILPTAASAACTGFDDVPESADCYESVIYLAECEIAAGTENDCFSPKQLITVEQWAVMLCRAYGVETIGDSWQDVGRSSVVEAYRQGWLNETALSAPNIQLCRGALLKSAFAAAKIPVYDSVLYTGGVSLPDYENCIRIGKELQLCGEEDDANEIVTRRDAAMLLHAILTRAFAVTAPAAPVTLVNAAGVNINDYLLALRQVPEPMLAAFEVAGWTYRIDFNYISELSKQLNMSCIFNLYLAGETVDNISKMMQAENYDIPGKTISFSKGMIMNMLSNERYCGDAILQKSVTVDCIEKKRKKNTGEAPMYYVQNNHPAIIDRVTFNKVQEELARRKTKTPGSAKSSITSTGKYSRYALTDVLICGNCGTRYRRVTWSRNGTKRIVWRCISRLDYGKKYCSDSPTIMEDKLQEAIVRAVNKFNKQDNATYKALMRATISEALGLNGDPEEVDMLERKVEALNNKMLALVNESVSSGDGIEAHESEFMTLSQETELLKQRIAAIQESTAKDNGEQSRLEQIQAIISERESKCMEYDDSIVRQMVECIKVYPGGKLEIIFGGGYLVEESV